MNRGQRPRINSRTPIEAESNTSVSRITMLWARSTYGPWLPPNFRDKRPAPGTIFAAAGWGEFCPGVHRTAEPRLFWSKLENEGAGPLERCGDGGRVAS